MNTIENANAEQPALAIERGSETPHALDATSWPLLPIAVRVKRRGRPGIWVPLFLLWPLIIAVFCLALPLCAIWPAPRRSALAALGATYQLLCALHGTHVEVTGSDGDWNISLY